MSAPIEQHLLDGLRDTFVQEEYALLEKAGAVSIEVAEAVIEGEIEGIRLFMMAEFGSRRAYEVLQQAADQAAMPLIGGA